MELSAGMCLTWVVGVVPLAIWLLLRWNDLWYGLSVKSRCSNTGTKLPPGYMGVPFFGEMLTFLWYFKFLRNPDEFIDSKRRRYGKELGIYRSHLFGSPAIISCSPSFNRIALHSEAELILEWPTVDIVGRNSIVTVQGTLHARIRSLVTRAINQPDALRRIALMVQPRVVAALQSWAEKGTIIAFDEIRKVTFENICSFFASLEAGPILDSLDKLFGGMLNGVRANPINFPGTAYHYGVQCRKKALAIFGAEMERRRKNRDGASAMDDVMGRLMTLKDGEGKPLKDIEVLDNIVSLVVAGYESTSLSIMWAVYYLAKYPNVLQKLREEHMTLRKNKDGEFITSDEISKLQYTNRVVEETIRMANIAAFTFRTATKDVDYKGYKIPKGWKVVLWARYLHTDPENFEDPLCFNPDRWNEPAKPGAYLAFGGGARICAGNMLARLQVAIFIHHLVVGYKWELVNPNAEMKYLPHPKPVDGVHIAISRL